MSQLAFTAYGIAQPKGSAKAFIPKGWNRAIVTSANPKNKGWQQTVAESASAAISSLGGTFRLFDGPVELRVVFYLPRPKAIRDRIEPHVKKPDLDKLVRSVKDALKGIAWRDDSQVDRLYALKEYAGPGDPPRVHVEAYGEATADDSQRSTRKVTADGKKSRSGRQTESRPGMVEGRQAKAEKQVAFSEDF